MLRGSQCHPSAPAAASGRMAPWAKRRLLFSGAAPIALPPVLGKGFLLRQDN
jgi:hypothetical protein